MISVCMATYNGEKYIYQQLESIYKQTQKPDELIICDDCSTDETVSIICKFIESHNLINKWHILSNKSNKGYPENFYYALSMCNGDYIFLSDQDDIWDIQKIERMYTIISSNLNINILSCQYDVIDENGKLIHNIMTPCNNHNKKVNKITFKKIFKKYCWPGMTMVVRHGFYNSICNLKLNKLPHDLVFAILAAEKDGFYMVNYVGSYHRRHDNNIAQEEHKIGKLLKRDRKIQEIEVTNSILKNILQFNVLKNQSSRDYVKKRLGISTNRLEYIQSREIIHTLFLYMRNYKELRMKSLVCDLILEIL